MINFHSFGDELEKIALTFNWENLSPDQQAGTVAAGAGAGIGGLIGHRLGVGGADRLASRVMRSGGSVPGRAMKWLRLKGGLKGGLAGLAIGGAGAALAASHLKEGEGTLGGSHLSPGAVGPSFPYHFE